MRNFSERESGVAVELDVGCVWVCVRHLRFLFGIVYRRYVEDGGGAIKTPSGRSRRGFAQGATLALVPDGVPEGIVSLLV